jgi:hypothetical protein
MTKNHQSPIPPTTADCSRKATSDADRAELKKQIKLAEKIMKRDYVVLELLAKS